MRLKSVRIQNFKCIEDSGEFSVGQVTCLVGKNESGKSAVLQALYKLNSVVDTDAGFNGVVEYPRRHWSRYKESKRDDTEANVLTTTWELDKMDLAAIAEVIGREAFGSQEVIIEKGYDNKPVYRFDVDETVAVKYLLSCGSLHQEELAEFNSVDTLQDLIGRLREACECSERHKQLLMRLETTFPDGSVHEAVKRVLEQRLPKFVYFADYHRLPGKVSLTDLQQRINKKQPTFEDLVFQALLALSGTSLEELQRIGRFEEFNAELEAVSNRITDTIFEYWSQNRHLAVEFHLDTARPGDPPPFNSGHVFRTRIRNDRHRVTVSFDERSTGFVWFFSFLVWFSQLQNTYGDNLFILLDEPGLSLHARAQQDLLRYINERLRPFYQVIYTTHSPFMVDPENLLSVRTVEDVVSDGNVEGTKVSDQVFSTDADTLFPLQAALGYEITQSLFVGKHVLLVEGPSDFLYLKWFSGELERSGRVGLDKRWVITPCGGIDKVCSFLALFRGNQLNVAVLTDFHEGDKKKVRGLKESNLLKQGHVFTAEMFVSQSEADIEDVVGRELYVDLVNRCYRLDEPLRLPVERRAEAPERVVKEVEHHFALLSPNAPAFDHYAPAAFLMEAGGKLRDDLPGLKEALNRFEKMFQTINSLLP